MKILAGNTMKPILFFTVILVFFVPVAFADSVSINMPAGTAVPGCEETNECYIPYEVTVDVDGEVTWTNDDTAAHTVTSGSPADGPSGVFDSSIISAGATFSHTFEEEGIYPYFCMVHPWMLGIIEASGEKSFIPSQPSATTVDVLDSHKVIEDLKKEVATLKLENDALMHQIEELQNEVHQLEDIILNALKDIYNWIPKP